MIEDGSDKKNTPQTVRKCRATTSELNLVQRNKDVRKKIKTHLCRRHYSVWLRSMDN